MRLINADALGIGRCNPDIMTNRAYAAGWNGVVNIINDAPTIDPVKHGRWNAVGKNHYTQINKCSACGASYDFISNFCPSCGAKMDGAT